MANDRANRRIVLPLPLALLLENVRASGALEAYMLECLQKKQLGALADRAADPSMDFDERLRLAGELEVDWERVLQEGYEFGFLHLNGLKKLLRFRFNRVEGRDYRQDGYRLVDLSLQTEEAEALKELIYRQWSVAVDEGAALGGKQIFNVQNIQFQVDG